MLPKYEGASEPSSRSVSSEIQYCDYAIIITLLKRSWEHIG